MYSMQNSKVSNQVRACPFTTLEKKIRILVKYILWLGWSNGKQGFYSKEDEKQTHIRCH